MNTNHLHPEHYWPPFHERCLSGLSSRSLCLTGNQSVSAWGLKTSHPSSCPYLDLQTDTNSSLQKCVTITNLCSISADKVLQSHHCCFLNRHSLSGSKEHSTCEGEIGKKFEVSMVSELWHKKTAF